MDSRTLKSIEEAVQAASNELIKSIKIYNDFMQNGIPSTDPFDQIKAWKNAAKPLYNLEEKQQQDVTSTATAALISAASAIEKLSQKRASRAAQTSSYR